MISIFKRKPKEETVSRAEYAAASRAYQATIQRLTEERDSYRALLTEKEAKLAKIMAPLVAANARRKAQARDKQQAEVG